MTLPFMLLAGLCAALSAEPAGEPLRHPPARKTVKVFLFAGQSNMEGRADGRALGDADKARLAAARKRVQLAYNDEPLRPLDVVQPSKEIEDIYHLDRIFGPELFFGISLAEAWPDEQFLFIKYAVGGSSLHGCWNPDWSRDKAALMGEQDEPRLYDKLTACVKQVLSGYKPGEYELCAMLWVQGEGDAKVEAAGKAYGDNLGRLIERIRADTQCKALPFMLLQTGQDGVVEGMKRTAATLDKVTLLPQSLEPGHPDFYDKIENGHYTCAGMKKLGCRFAETYLERYGVKRP